MFVQYVRWRLLRICMGDGETEIERGGSGVKGDQHGGTE
jgi:hypothetical protein